jgi:GTP-binding protein
MQRNDIRNIAIIAHVDHGKTTLVDAMLRQTNAMRNIEEMGERIMDSMDLERERGITIKAKNASIFYKDTKINIVDTPGHADFGGEVERTLNMADGVLLLVDAKEGPMPQTRFVLKKALEKNLKAIVVINKIDRKDARIDEVVDKTFDLFVELGASPRQLDFPIVYTSALKGVASLEGDKEGKDLIPLFETILKYIPPPTINEGEIFKMLVVDLGYDNYKGKMAIGKILSGEVKKGDQLIELKIDSSKVNGKVTALLAYQGLLRKEVESAQAGDIVAISGFADISIGETLSDVRDLVPLPPILVDEPTVKMTFGVNTSPFSGREGNLITSRNIRERLFKETETNVSLRVQTTESMDTFLVSGRGELQLAILIETMRREGFEVQISQPEVILKEINGTICEPYEYLTIEVPQDFQGVIIEEIGLREGVLQNMISGELGVVTFEYVMPTRGILGLKNALLTKTKGMAIVHHIFDSYKPLREKLFSIQKHGSLIASESGLSNSYGLNNAQQRGVLFIGPGVEVYEGMVVGQNAYDSDLELNVCKTKKMTNVRASGSDEAIVLTPPRELTLDLALEYIGPDELLEVTPKSLRIRKKILSALQRKREKRATEK